MGTTLFSGGPIVTCEPGGATAEALLVEDDRITAVGRGDDLRARAGAETTRIDLQGAALLPGFIDAHHHFCMAAFDRRTPDLHMSSGARVEDVLERVRAHAAASPGDGWVRLQGYDPSRLRERRAPHRRELDAICPDRPVLLIAYSCHEGVVNSAGLAALGWDRSTPDPRTGSLSRDRRGELTGELIEAPYFRAEAHSRTAALADGEDAWIAEAHEHGRALLAAGLVRVADPTVDPTFERLYERAVDADMLPLTVHRMPVGGQSMVEARVDGTATGSGPARSPIGPAKLFLDGAERCALCASALDIARAGLVVMRLARADGLAALRAAITPGGWTRGDDHLWHSGTSFYRMDELVATIDRAGRSGLQVAQHAIGNEAVAQALDALERSSGVLDGLPGRPRIEHAMIVDAGLERRLAGSGAVCVVQPLWIRELGDVMRLLPLPPHLRALGLRSLLDAGASVAGSSDYPVEHYDVLGAIGAAVTRKTSSGATHDAEQAIGVDEALGLYTTGAARALGVEAETGSLAPGKRADLVVLDADPRAVEPERIAALNVLRTYVDGELAHRLDPVREQ